jgi:nucleoside-diphosphate-sugar epimerase
MPDPPRSDGDAVSGTLAVTGGTGFVGKRFIDLALTAGWQVRALTRSPQPEADGLNWVSGSLSDSAALASLVSDVDAVIHIAGAVNAPDRAAFAQANIAGTQSVIDAAKASGVRRFIHVSSLAAREPGLSNYGWSKAGAEDAVRASGLDWVMVRPPGIYGPGDRDQLDLFKAARLGVMPLPPAGRLSLLHVDDLTQLLLVLAASGAPSGTIFEADDGCEGGWSHTDYARAIADAVGRKPLLLPLPAALIGFGAKIDRALRGGKAKLTADRAAYFCHPDWVIDATARPPLSLWVPEVETRQGLRDTAKWYGEAGWL